jgi:hypothetical protein
MELSMLEKRALESLTVDSFQPHTGKEFLIENSPEPVKLRLISAQSSKAASPSQGMRLPFSLIFKSTAQQLLAQGTYSLAHEQFGKVDIFIVPVGQDAEEISYQAVFN